MSGPEALLRNIEYNSGFVGIWPAAPFEFYRHTGSTLIVAGLRPIFHILFRSLGLPPPRPHGLGLGVAPQNPRGGFGGRQPPNPGGLGGASPPGSENKGMFFPWPKARYDLPSQNPALTNLVL